MWVEPRGKVHCSGGLENCMFVIMLILVVQLVVSHAVSIDYLRLLALSLAMLKIIVGFTSCSIKLLLPNTTAYTKAVIAAPPDFIWC